MDQPHSDPEIVADLAEEFVELHRQGKRPNIEDYIRRYPQFEKEISELFPTLLVVENLAPQRDASVVGDEQETLRPIAAFESLGDFRILREVGRGGMGIVYEAEQVSLGRRVALKVLANPQLSDARHRIRFQREARSAAKLHHTNIVPVFGVGEEDGTNYYVMQLIQGLGLDETIAQLRQMRSHSHHNSESDCADGASPRTVRDSPATIQMARSLLQGNFGQFHTSNASDDENTERAIGEAASSSAVGDSVGRLSNSSLSVAAHGSSSRHARKPTYWDSVARIGVQVAGALQYAHDHSILHRDIKPSNLLLDNSGTVWVTDFGLAKAMDQQDLTDTGDLLGTLRYMPPEAFTSKADHRGDIYSLGITIYEMLALRPAYSESNRHRLIAQVSDGPPERLERVDAEIPRDLVTIVHKAIERDPDHRYQNASEMAEDFARFVDDEPIKARRVSVVERGVRWSRRNKGMTAALASIALLLVFGTVASAIFAVQFRSERDSAKYAKYVSNIQAGYHLVTEFGSEKYRATVLLRTRLEAAPPEYQNWEWAYLANLAWRFNTPIQPSTISAKKFANSAQFWNHGTNFVVKELVASDGFGSIETGKYNDDYTLIYVVASDGSIGMFDASSGVQLESFRQPDTHLSSASPSPDGKKLLVAALAGGAFIYDLKASDKTKPIVQHPVDLEMPTCWDWAWSPDGKYVVASLFGHTCRIWDSTTLKEKGRLTGHKKDVRAFHFLDDNTVLTASLDGTVRTWSFPEGEPGPVYKAPKAEGMTYHAISQNGEYAVATFADGSSFVWKIKEGEVIPLSDPDANLSGRRKSAAFSADGSCVAVIGVMDGLFSVTIYDVTSGERGEIVGRINGGRSPFTSVCFNQDGTQVMTLSAAGTAKIWSSRPVQSDDVQSFANAHDDVIFQIDFDPSGERLLTGGFDDVVRVWDLKTRTLLASYQEHDANIVAVDFSVDGAKAASLDAKGHLHVWDPKAGAKLFSIDPESDRFALHMSQSGGKLLDSPAVLSTGLFTPDGLHLVTFQKNAMKVFSAKDGSFVHELAGTSDHGWPVCSHDSTLVTVLGMNKKTARVWDLGTGKRKKQLIGHKRNMTMVDFSPKENLIVSGGVDKKTIVWNAETGKILHELKGRDGFGFAFSCRFSANGQFILTGYYDNRCRIWNSHTGELITTLRGHAGAIRDVRLSPDGTRILSWATDDQAIVWDFEGPYANQLVVLSGKSRLIQAHWSPDGRNIVSAWSDGSIKVWAGATKEDLTRFTADQDDSKEEFTKQFEIFRKNRMILLGN